MRTIRTFGPCLFGLYLVTQLAGVLPLIYAHTLSVFGTTEIVSELRGGDWDSDARHRGTHHHGTIDDRCCALHGMMDGILPHVIDGVPIDVAKTPMLVAPTNVFADADPTLLDRPPKPLPLI